MPDLLPDAAARWRRMEARLAAVCDGWGYSHIRLPLVERTELFRRSVGDTSDIVGKEMYQVRGGTGKDDLSLRPEGTAGCVRAAVEHRLLDGPCRLWYLGQMFRHERPQKGRLRQFHQMGVETFGMAGPDIDAEVVALAAALWDALGLAGRLRLQINSIGDAGCRARYRQRLVEYLTPLAADLDEDSQRRLESNPLRILDSKDPRTIEILSAAPRLDDCLGDDARRHFADFRAALDALGLEYRVNRRLVRGLDYYNRTVFEWQADDGLGSQNALCAGGRYDGLARQLGGADCPALGFALGLERLMLMLDQSPADNRDAAADCYLIATEQEAQTELMALAMRLRRQLPHLRIVQHCGGGKLKAAMRRADRSGARLALILGASERAAGQISAKDMRTGHGGDQTQLDSGTGLAGRIQSMLGNGAGGMA